MYKSFYLTLGISFFIMYGVMFLNLADSGDIFFSITRTYMSLLMVSPMAVVIVLMMGQMYPDKKKNTIILFTGIAGFVIAFILLRTQPPIGEVQYMKAMIPHHCSAVMTSKHVDLKDPEVRALAASIVQSQEEEIKEMKAIINRIQK